MSTKSIIVLNSSSSSNIQHANASLSAPQPQVASFASSLSLDPSPPDAPQLARVKAVFQQIPTKAPLSNADIEKMYHRYFTNARSIADPTVDHHLVTNLARTVISGPKGLSIAVMDRVSEGDLAISDKGAFKIQYHGAGLHDAEHYAVGLCDLANLLKKHHPKEFASNPAGALDWLTECMNHEAELGRNLEGVPYVLPTILAFPSKGKYYFVTKYIPGGDLESKILALRDALLKKKEILPFYDRIRIGCKILQGVEELHKRNIFHRDLKPRNVLLDERMNPWICDFGLATSSTDTSIFGMKRRCGTPYFAPPEMGILSDGPSEKILTSDKTDVWSAGVLLYQLLTFSSPWNRKEAICLADVYKQVAGLKSLPWKTTPRVDLAGIDASVKALLSQMIQVDPNKRISISESRKTFDTIDAELTPAYRGEPVENKEWQQRDAISLPQTARAAQSSSSSRSEESNLDAELEKAYDRLDLLLLDVEMENAYERLDLLLESVASMKG